VFGPQECCCEKRYEIQSGGPGNGCDGRLNAKNNDNFGEIGAES